MILSTIHNGKHVDDGDLIRLRDGECPLSEERVLRRHLDGCATCRENSERVEHLAVGFFAAMEEIQHPEGVQSGSRNATWVSASRRHMSTPLPWHARRAVRVAAATAAVLAIALTAAPVRAFVAAGWQAVMTLFSAASTPAFDVQQASSLVSFVPQGEDFLVDFVNTQSRGTLSVVVDTGVAASARVLGGDGLDELIVLQAGLRVRNRTVSSSDFELRLPPSLRNIEIRIAGRTVATFSTTGLSGGARWEVDLSTSGGG